MKIESFRRVNPAASLKPDDRGRQRAIRAIGFRRVNPAASLKQLKVIDRRSVRYGFRRVNPAASLKLC